MASDRSADSSPFTACIESSCDQRSSGSHLERRNRHRMSFCSRLCSGSLRPEIAQSLRAWPETIGVQNNLAASRRGRARQPRIDIFRARPLIDAHPHRLALSRAGHGSVDFPLYCCCDSHATRGLDKAVFCKPAVGSGPCYDDLCTGHDRPHDPRARRLQISAGEVHAIEHRCERAANREVNPSDDHAASEVVPLGREEV